MGSLKQRSDCIDVNCTVYTQQWRRIAFALGHRFQPLHQMDLATGKHQSEVKLHSHVLVGWQPTRQGQEKGKLSVVDVIAAKKDDLKW